MSNGSGSSFVPDRDREVVCWTTDAGGATIFTGTIRHDDSVPEGWVLFDQNVTLVLPSEPGLTFVSCDQCCPIVLADDLCATGGRTGIVALRNPDGTIEYLDPNDGSAVLPGDIVGCPDPNATQTLNSHVRLLAATESWTPGDVVGGTLTALSATGLTGTYTVTDSDATVAAGIPAGATVDWQAEDANTLVPVQSITAAAASTVLITWTVRV